MLKDQVVFITGSTQGIGYAVLKEFLYNGYYVIGCSRKEQSDLSHDFCTLLHDYETLDYYQCDTTNEKDVSQTFRNILEKYKRIDVVVNNVGESEKKSLMTISIEQFKRSIDINLISTVNCTKAALKPMIMQKSGKIINISSIAGTNGLPFESHYSAAKAGIIGFTKSIAKEYGLKGITCNAVVPGIINTKDSNSDLDNDVIKNIALRRVGKPFDIAGLVCFLGSEKADYITGQVIKIDGGLFI